MAVKNTVKVWATSTGKQSFETDITTPTDPTGATPKFGLTTVGDLDGPAAWTAGAWSGTYTDKTTAVTPTIGATAASPSLPVESGNKYWVWAQVTLGGEVWTEPVGEIVVP
jgi:hypothetical protein